MSDVDFRYDPACSVAGCRAVAIYKVAAVWSNGTFRELKPYGFACEAHRAEVCQTAGRRQSMLRPAEGESVEPVSVFRLARGVRDANLERAGA